MFKKTIASVTLMTAIAGTAIASGDLPIKSVDVDMNIQKMPWDDSNGAKMHPTLPAELTAAIKSEMDKRMPENGFEVDVDIWDVTMNEMNELPSDGRFDRLGGFVYVNKSEGTEPDYTFPILMHAKNADSIGTEVLEDAMIAAFADEAADRLDEVTINKNKAGAVD